MKSSEKSAILSTYHISCYAPISLELSAHVKHAGLVAGLQMAPEPWTSRQPFKPLNTSPNTITMHCARRGDFGPWVDSLDILYPHRIPAAQGSPDRILITIDPNRMQPPVWLDGLVQVLLKSFEPAVVAVRNQAGWMTMSEDDRLSKMAGKDVPNLTKILQDSFNVRAMPQVLFLSQAACKSALGISSETLRVHLVQHGVAVDVLERGILIRGADKYISAEEYVALSRRLTALVKEAIGVC